MMKQQTGIFKLLAFYKLVRIIALLLITSIIFLSFISPVKAQNYSFSVPQLFMDVYVQRDASVNIVYDITFANNSGADPIDIVDIGTPTSDYTLSQIEASINEQELTDIRTSEYIDVGIEIHLHEHAIQPGSTGTLHVEFSIPDMVYQDTTNEENASMRITPTWFDSSLVTGSSDIRVAIHTLPGISPDDLLYQDEKVPFTDKQVIEDRAVGIWGWSDGTATKKYLVGMSFPKTGMDRVVEMSAFDLLGRWIDQNSEIVGLIGAIIALGVTFLIYKVAGTQGCVAIVFAFLGIILACSNPGALIFLIPVGFVIFGVIRDHRNKHKYLPPVAQVEGGGIKRGLTAVEAAVLLEIPPHKVLMLVIFGMLKKGVLRQTVSTPLTVEIVEQFRGKDKKALYKEAQQAGIVLHPYEIDFLEKIDTASDKAISAISFKDPMKKLVKDTVKRVAGFDLSDTQDYYRRIIKRALEQAEEIGDVSELEQKLDRNMEWILMNKDYDTAFGKDRGYRYVPIWMRHSHSYGGSSSSAGGSIGGGAASSGGGSGSSGGDVSFGDVAGSFAGWTETTFGTMADKLTPESLGTVPRPSKSSSGWSSGGGGCACACAGCACACACAGGGR